MIKIGFAREVITPERGVSLCGYFNPRPNTGVLDNLHVKAFVFESGGVRGGILSFELALMSLEFVQRLQKELADNGISYWKHVILTTTHVHTGPYVSPFFGYSPPPEAVEVLVKKAILAILRAEGNLADAEVFRTKAVCDTLAFNRRYWMKDGSVVTNPGKNNPNVVKPEGPIDPEIPLLVFKQNGRIALILPNIVNHTDTVGGDMVSADWPGRLERAVQNALGYDVPVLTLIGPSGNINHFNLSWDDPQEYSYSEAIRIGNGYAKAILPALDSLIPVDSAELRIDTADLKIPFRTIPDGDVQKAKETLARVGNTSSDKNLTSEGIAAGEGPVAKFFAEQLLKFNADSSGKTRTFELVSVKLGQDFVLVSVPGEPFVEIGLAIKKASPFAETMVVELSQGSAGYIPMQECFEHGGYEILTVEGGGPAQDTADRLIAACWELIRR